MCHLAVESARAGDQQVLDDIYRIMRLDTKLRQGSAVDLSLTHDSPASITTSTESSTSALTVAGPYVPTPEELCSSVLHTVYMGTENSSEATSNRARSLSHSIGAYHSSINIDAIVSAILSVFRTVNTAHSPRYQSQGGTAAEDLALQNIQARSRMVMAYLCAQLFPWVRGRSGFLLVLGSANVDESLRGYMTKYDCSSADINPIGGISKGDLKRMMLWAAEKYLLPALSDIAGAPPTVCDHAVGLYEWDLYVNVNTCSFILISHSFVVYYFFMFASCDVECSILLDNFLLLMTIRLCATKTPYNATTAQSEFLKMLNNISHSYLPQAELRPIEQSVVELQGGDYSQLDEEDMGMSYADLGIYGALRKVRFRWFLQILNQTKPNQSVYLRHVHLH